MITNLLNNKYKWVIISFLISLILTGVKFYAYTQTLSLSIYSDAVESIANVLATAFLIYTIYYSTLPRDYNHPYGHGKIEYFSTGFEGGLILLSGIYVLFEAYHSYLSKTNVTEISEGIILTTISMVVNILYGYFLQIQGKKMNSLAIVADGKHLFGDGLTSLAIIVGLVLVTITGYKIIDIVLAIILSLYLIYNGFDLIKKAFKGLMDETDEEVIINLVKTLEENRKKEWIDLHNFRVIQYGQSFHIDCHLTLPFYFSLEESHAEVQKFEELIRNATTKDSEIFTHTDPCIKESCTVCQLIDCQVRQLDFIQKKDWKMENTVINKKHKI